MPIKPVAVQLASAQWGGLSIPATVTDLHEDGCGLKLARELAPGMAILLSGELAGPGETVALRGRIAWCEMRSHRDWRAGVSFAEKFSRAGPAEGIGEPEDYYEVLQISPNADAETIQRVYRFLAQRFHPDNAGTGDVAQFRRIREAFETLRSPEKRAAYDAAYARTRARRWKIFNQETAARSVESEKALREGILGLLYTKRRVTPESPGMSSIELEDLLGVAREHLEFPLWYLKEHGQITRSDGGRYAITVKGVDQAEQEGAAWQKRAAERRPLLTAK